MPSAPIPPGKSFLYEDSQGDIDVKLLGWIRGLVESHEHVTNALERLRESYTIAIAGKSVCGSDEVLAQAEIALETARKARFVK